jgi:hypothetical protein
MNNAINVFFISNPLQKGFSVFFSTSLHRSYVAFCPRQRQLSLYALQPDNQGKTVQNSKAESGLSNPHSTTGPCWSEEQPMPDSDKPSKDLQEQIAFGR